MTWRRMVMCVLAAAATGSLPTVLVIAADPSPKAPAKPAPAEEKPAAPAGEQMDNPQFLVWKKFDVGASSTLSTTIDTGQQGRTMEIQSVQKLAEKAADHLVIETTPSVKVLDQVHQLPVQRLTVQAKTEKKELKRLPDEKVAAAGQTFTCKVYQMKQPNPRGTGEVEAKVWFNDAVPGGTVRMEGSAAQMKFTMVLQSYSDK